MKTSKMKYSFKKALIGVLIIFLVTQTTFQVSATTTSNIFPYYEKDRGHFSNPDRLEANDDSGAECAGSTWGKVETKYHWYIYGSKTVTSVTVSFEAKVINSWGRIKIFCYDGESNLLGTSGQSDLISSEWGSTYTLTADFIGEGVVIRPDNIRVYLRVYKGWWGSVSVDWCKAYATYS